MKAELRLECKNCIEDITLDVAIDGKYMTPMRTIREMAFKQGWHLGRDCYCPACLKALPNHCDNCAHYEGNKTMCSPGCRKDGKFTLGGDYCEDFEPIRGADGKVCIVYKNPIPTLD